MTETQTYLLTADQVLPGLAGERIKDGAVLVQNGLITAVGSADELTREAGDTADVRHFPGSTIMPGMIDAHVHLSGDAGTEGPEILTRIKERDDEQLLADMHGRAAAAARVGITTLRDVGDSRGLVRRLRSADAETGRLPRLLTAGAPITVPGGAGAAFGGAVEDGDLAGAVQQRAEHGADFVSVLTSGSHLGDGGPPPYETQFARDELAILVDTAHGFGLPVTVHAHAATAIADAAALGVDTIEHATWVTGPQAVHYDDAVARSLADQGIAVTITGSLNWRRIVAQMGETRARENFYGRISWLDNLDVPVLLGSRAGTANAPFNDLVSAVEMAAWAGVPYDRAVEAVTSRAAAALGLSSATGQLAPDLAADVLVVDGDPLADLAALRRVQAVLMNGSWQ